MKKIRIALLSTAALCIYPVVTFAQEGDSTPKDQSAGEAPGAKDQAGEAAEGADADKPASEKKEEGGLGSICEIDPEACPKLDFRKEAERDINEQMYAVQQVFVLRQNRVELQPYWLFSLNDQFVSHNGPGLGFNYWITNVLAIGANGNFYRPFNVDSEFNFQTRRAARIGVPLTEYNWGAAVNFTYAPILGKFSAFSDFIFQYDAYVVGGVGAISVRPIPVIDPDNRNFEFETKLAFNAGLGLHLFFNRWLAATMEVRDYIFNDHLENTEIAATVAEQRDDSTWYGGNRLTNNVQAQLGLSIFFPFSFDYRLPK
jgi:outer membrane beta-barrel protein